MGVGVVGVAGKGEKPVLHLIPSWSEELGAWSDQERKSTGYSIVVHKYNNPKNLLIYSIPHLIHVRQCHP